YDTNIPDIHLDAEGVSPGILASEDKSGLMVYDYVDNAWALNINTNNMEAVHSKWASVDTPLLTNSEPTNLYIEAPNGNVMFRDLENIRNPAWVNTPAGIRGFRIWPVRHVDPGGPDETVETKIEATHAEFDNMHVRFFTADELRVNRGEEWWSEDYITVEEEFIVPLVGETVYVWGEAVPELGAAFWILDVGDFVQFRIMNWPEDGGFTYGTIWFKVAARGAMDEENSRQGYT
ncbi:MAG: hypothetical protein GY809_11445, partial [Planctomycetes bacterium]|nr:hypothetical protein [Planctomycetota bacterium]